MPFYYTDQNRTFNMYSISVHIVLAINLSDPLLPRAIEFLREFQSFFYKILAHVLRKTEYHLWDYVIKAAGPGCSIKELFEQCLFVEELEDHLDVAASYFLILQQRESLEASRQHALLLLDRALAAEKWELVRDLIRFLSCIAPEELDASQSYEQQLSSPSPLSSFAQSHLSLKSSNARTLLPAGNASAAASGNVSAMANTPAAAAATCQVDLKCAGAVAAGRLRHATGPVAPPSSASTSKPAAQTVGTDCAPAHAPDSISPPSLTAQVSSASSNLQPMILIEQLLNKFARNLLSHYRLRKLGFFAAHIPQFSLVEFLRRESRRDSSKVENMVAALEALHEEFDWPYPSCDQNDCASDSTSGIVAGAPPASPVALSKAQQQLPLQRLRPGTAGAALEVTSENGLPARLPLPSPPTLQSIPSATMLPPQNADAAGQRLVNVFLQPTGESTPHAGLSSGNSNHRVRNYSTALETSEQHGSSVSRTRRSSETSSITNGSSVYNLLMPAAAAPRLKCSTASKSMTTDSSSFSSKLASTLDKLALAPSARDPRLVQRERQLRHLYRQLLDAECFEYALLVCVLLRDNLCLFELIDRLQALLQSAAVAPASAPPVSSSPPSQHQSSSPEGNSNSQPQPQQQQQQQCAQPGLVVQTHCSSLSNSGEYLGAGATSMRPLTRPELVQVLRRLFAGLQQLNSWAASAAPVRELAKFQNRAYAKFFGGLLEHMRVHFLWAFNGTPKKQLPVPVTSVPPAAVSAPLSVDAALSAGAQNQSAGGAKVPAAPRTLDPLLTAGVPSEAAIASTPVIAAKHVESLFSPSTATTAVEGNCAPATGSNSDGSTNVSSVSRSSSPGRRESVARLQQQQQQQKQALLGVGAGCSQQPIVCYSYNVRAFPGRARPAIADRSREAFHHVEQRGSLAPADEAFHVVSNAEPPPTPDESLCTIS